MTLDFVSKSLSNSQSFRPDRHASRLPALPQVILQGSVLVKVLHIATMIVEILLFAVGVILLHYWISRPRGMPPGPMVIPYLGSRLIFTVSQVQAMHKIYGDIFKSEIGSHKLIFLCSNKLIKEALAKVDFADRPRLEVAHFLTDGQEAGVIMSNGKRWQNARRFLLRNLRDLGMGKTYLEESILEEARALVKDFRSCAGTPANVPESLNVAVLNVIWQLVASRRYDLHDKEVLEPIAILRSIDSSSLATLVEFFPGVKKLLPGFLEEKLFAAQMKKLKDSIVDLLKDTIDSHRATLDPTNPRDVIDEYLIAIDEKSEIAEYFGELDLMRIIFDLFAAGFDTTANTLRWVILYMARFPEVQRRVQQQIDEVVPRDTLPSYQHKSRLPLLEATIQEVLRSSSMLHNGVQRAAQADTYLGGYFIPKGSWVFGCSGICHMDSRYWEEPQEFRPERFLDQEGKVKTPKEGLIPFGSGRRSCLGEALSRMELYIFSAALLQNFTFSPPAGIEVDLEANSKQPSARLSKEQNIVISIRE
ncbi:cytochrome P450 2L1-like isoform X1 [Penaeus monodon]|uniref:cytochrome P450 2L1-like isoform X1 n=2 Tax=Penaeus monodon TaxID=6687 RepID=UPI0018A7ACFB|nr:cytochrome P450 2L1-like isoform X1 [Penaeus monodon]